MCAQTNSAHPAAPGPKDPEGFSQAMEQLRLAVEGRRVEPICTSYLLLRRAASGMSLLGLLKAVQPSLSDTSLSAVVSAFAHRQCFMCQDGASICRTCKGAGTVDRFSCPACDGLTVEPCTFCLGTAWSDRGEVPAELRKLVLRRQMLHVEKDTQALPRITHQLRQVGPSISPRNRQQAASWLFRVQARLANLAGEEPGAETAARYGRLAAQIESLLEMLRRTLRQAESEDPLEGLGQARGLDVRNEKPADGNAPSDGGEFPLAPVEDES